MLERQITKVIQAILLNQSTDISELISQISLNSPSILHDIVLALTNLRQLSDKPLTLASFNQLVLIIEKIFDVYIKYCDKLLFEKQKSEQLSEQKQRDHSPEPTNICTNPSFADMNILLNSLFTYFMISDCVKLHVSTIFRGHKLFTSHLLWRGLFQAALSEVNIDMCEENMVFMVVPPQIVIYIQHMRALGLVEEDVRLWVQYFINTSFTSKLNQQYVYAFMEQFESVFQSSDQEEQQLPLQYLNKIVRVTPNYTGYRAQLVNPDRLKRIQFQEEPLFNSEQEQLIKELTTMLSEPVEMETQYKQQNEEIIHALSREELIDKIWAENTNLISYDKMVPNGQADNLNSMIDQYLKAMDGPDDEKEDSEWDDERQLEYIQNEFSVE
ncbi:Conserved_hypothetical protein [Hexamita inflata]|uniref:Uncharacterized protein n=1 Tax=Hexamita inflata TaxID=28002 RepID=A0AA86PD35_9EUKA|nr:Conserved hypothetical protein [Hexamita inflata]